MEPRKQIIAGLIGLNIGLFGGLRLGSYTSRVNYSPKAVYVLELNGDNRLDLVVEANRGSETAFLQQEDRTYKRLDQILDEQRESIGKKFNKINIDEQLESIGKKLNKKYKAYNWK